jgi:hypothetical protein
MKAARRLICYPQVCLSLFSATSRIARRRAAVPPGNLPPTCMLFPRRQALLT